MWLSILIAAALIGGTALAVMLLNNIGRAVLTTRRGEAEDLAIRRGLARSKVGDTVFIYLDEVKR